MLTTVLLDVGGIILDESEMDLAFKYLLTELISTQKPSYTFAECEFDFAEAISYFCPSVYRFVIWKHTRKLDLYESMLAEFLELRKVRYPTLRLMPGIDRQLSQISSVFRIGLAGQYGRDIRDLLDKTNLLQYLTYCFTQDEFTLTKPDPRYFEQILNRCNLVAEECILVGDRIDNDIIPAKQVGMKTVRVRAGIHSGQEPRLPNEVPDSEITDIDELMATLLKLREKCR